jgi:hypothetical protein
MKTDFKVTPSHALGRGFFLSGAQGWRGILRREQQARARRVIGAAVLGVGAVAGAVYGVTVSWPW